MSLGATTWFAGALLGSIPWRWLPSFDLAPAIAPPGAAAPAVHERAPVRAPIEPPAEPPPRPLALPDEVILRAIDPGRTAFLRCWKRALDADPLLEVSKVRLRVEIDAMGLVTAVTHDAPSAKLGNCLAGVLRSFTFAPPGAPAVAEVPLFFPPG